MNKKPKYLLLGILILAIPVIAIAVWLDGMLVGERTLVQYVGVCVWEYILIGSGLVAGYWISRAWKEK